MTDEIAISGPSLAAFLDRIGLPQAARDRVLEIDRILARQLASDDLDADGCASLVLEAADLITDLDPAGFEWSGWDADNDDPGDVGSFDQGGSKWGEK